MAQLDRNPLHGADLGQAALQSSIPGAPISSDSTSDRHSQRADGSGRIVLGRFARSEWKGRFDYIVLVETARTSTNVQARVAGVLEGQIEILYRPN